MRIAIHNHYIGHPVSETEAARKMCAAAARLGWEAIEAGSSTEINAFEPDFVIALHFRTPKLTKYPTYGSMVSPPSYFAHEAKFVRNILSYDAFLSSSRYINDWLRDILYHSRKIHFVAPWYVSCETRPYIPPQLTNPRLFYVGTNWDGPRYRSLFEQLDKQPFTDIYGPPAGWVYLQQSYRGALPFDGSAMLSTLNRAGVGLCLHREEHCAAATPSSRIFEIAASGAVGICQQHPFIRDVFQDSVLYLDATDNAQRLTEQISEYMKWIAQHRDEALTLSRRAYDIFALNYTLEKLLSDLVPQHEELLRRKKLAANHAPKTLGEKSIQLIVRIGDRGATYVDRALDSIRLQNCAHIGAIIVQYKEVPGLSEMLQKYRDQLPIQVVQSSYTGSRSTQLWDGLRAVSSEYFGILDDDDAVHPNHASSLLTLLDGFPNCGVAYSGAIRIWEADPDSEPSERLPSEPAELAYFERFDPGRLIALDNFITSNAFIARSSLLDGLGTDPQLPLLEDLFLLLFLYRKTEFVFSYEATCEFRWRGNKKSNSVLLDQQNWPAARKRMESLLWKESFPTVQQIGGSGLSDLETRLTAIETKAEETALRVDRYVNLPFFRAIRRIRRKFLRLPEP